LAFSLVKDQLKKFPETIDLEFGGSFAKGTWLSKNADVDIFIKFKKETSEEKFVEISRKIFHKIQKRNFRREVCRNFKKNWFCINEKV
jgi:tRNA nucleotidyltransferase (CCA-adding enzyme)